MLITSDIETRALFPNSHALREQPLATLFAGVIFVRRNAAILGTISLDLFAVLARHAITRRAGLKMFQAVIVFGLATVVFGISHQLWISIIALAVMGAADTISVVVRSPLVQLATPDAMRGRVSAVNYLFINASNQLGAFESGATAALLGVVPAVVLGGIGTIAVALLGMRLFPTLRRVERLDGAIVARAPTSSATRDAVTVQQQVRPVR